VKSVEDLAGLVTDDLRGWYETRNGERVREPGILDGEDITAEAADAMIMEARIAMGWVERPAAEEADDDMGADPDGASEQ
jgi:N utilization substance protein A